MENFKIEVDGDGIALVTFDVPGRTMNTLTASVIREVGEVVERIKSDAAIKGAVITSGKTTGFCAGADLGELGGSGGLGGGAGRRGPEGRLRGRLRAEQGVPRPGDLRQAGGRGHQRPGHGRRPGDHPGLPLSRGGRQSEDPAGPAGSQGRPAAGRPAAPSACRA
jgi:hypothetical protein